MPPTNHLANGQVPLERRVEVPEPGDAARGPGGPRTPRGRRRPRRRATGRRVSAWAANSADGGKRAVLDVVVLDRRLAHRNPLVASVANGGEVTQPMPDPDQPAEVAKRDRRVERDAGREPVLVESHEVRVTRRRLEAVRDVVGAHAEEEHGARYLLQHVAEVLGAHDRERHLEVAVLAQHGSGDLAPEPDEPAVVHRDRVSRVQLHVDLAVVRGRDAPHHPLEALDHAESGHLADGADRSLEPGRLGDHVHRRSRRQVPDRDHGRIERVDATGDERLQRGDHLGGHRDRIVGEVRGRRVAAAVPDRDEEVVGRGHQRPGSGSHQPDGDVRRDVDGERGRDRLDQPVGEHALVEHAHGARRALLPRLEHEADRPGELVASSGQDRGRTDQHRHVGVVTADVGPTLDLAAIGPVGVLGHRQGVGVGPQEDRRTGSRPLERRHHRRQTRPGADVEAQRRRARR